VELFQRLLNVYKEADKRAGGFLPGGGTGNILSNAAKQINPAEVAGLYGPNVLNLAAKKIASKIVPVMTSASEATTLNQLPGLMNTASKRMTALGYPGTWSPSIPEGKINTTAEGRLPTKVDLNSGWTDLMGGPAFLNKNVEFGIEEPVVAVTSKTPGWVIAHELGHAVDAIKRPYDYALPRGVDFEQLGKREALRAASPGAIVTGIGSMKNDDDRTLLNAGIEGALSGIGASQQVLRKEVMADRFGMPIAKEAGVPWNTRQNILAKSTYALGATTPGFAQGVVGELLNRGVNTIGDLAGTAMSAMRGNQLNPTEQALTKYGYDPSQYQMSTKTNDVTIKKQNPAQQALYKFINRN
jgi:hypothetical protein